MEMEKRADSEIKKMSERMDAMQTVLKEVVIFVKKMQDDLQQISVNLI
jgi:hypothetical protein